MKKYVLWSSLAAVAGFLLLIVIVWVSASNREIDLRNKITAQQKNLEVVFDNTWKTISQEAKVSEKYKDSFKEIYTELMSERYSESDQQSLMRWVTEANPNFDASIYTKLMSTIGATRAEFTREQTKLLSFKNAHDNVIDKFPSSLFVGGRGKIVVNVVTSDKTEKVFEVGKENNIEVF